MSSLPSSTVTDSQDNVFQDNASRQVDSRTLLGSAGELVIVHENRRYVLRRTKSGKLILTA
ncbi:MULTISPECIES: hemin uptake protein HemP [unclassified Vreelandella]